MKKKRSKITYKPLLISLCRCGLEYVDSIPCRRGRPPTTKKSVCSSLDRKLSLRMKFKFGRFGVCGAHLHQYYS